MNAYAMAVDHFMEFPEELMSAWTRPSDHRYAFLFDHCSQDRCQRYIGAWTCIGCLTQIASTRSKVLEDAYAAETESLTERIRADVRLPVTIADLKYLSDEARLISLNAFAEWQRTIDRELNRQIPTIKPTAGEVRYDEIGCYAHERNPCPV